jgi:hypothetical protein
MSPGVVAPYQIKLESDGGLIWAPADDDCVVRSRHRRSARLVSADTGAHRKGSEAHSHGHSHDHANASGHEHGHVHDETCDHSDDDDGASQHDHEHAHVDKSKKQKNKSSAKKEDSGAVYAY